ncbi:DNA polymerase III subunit epsilon [Brachymonas denitrificans]|uniref:DNA polymerase III subunit epsilon n=1 Tax=Brachymonas denitrificans DSM 15123 TaxID=1121117 RepID=A0A1H8I2A5_9BURK|nr:DNA polymerase III subunit epsilon [Brachymonas denitrificans]SEN62216.1 DNA polymerase-3 subunit epsilon [Brachymonas denitrificans DSM 15123]
MRQIILDTETTGLEVSDGNRIIEIGCVELLNRQLTGNNLHLYINPERDSEEGALRVHGLTTEFLSDKPKFAQIVEDFLAYVQDAEVIIHNAAFDTRFLDHELQLLGREPFRAHVTGVIDSLALAKEQFPGKRNSLDALCDRFGIDNSSRTLHGALLDAELLADVYISLTRGQESLMMETGQGDEGTGSGMVQIDLSGIQLPVLRASAHELEAHAAMLQVIDKASGEKTIWKKISIDLQTG